jgi:hypothetical protein
VAVGSKSQLLKHSEGENTHDYRGSVAEWTNAPHLKCGRSEMASEVRILPLPPFDKLRALTYKTLVYIHTTLRPENFLCRSY